jgi:putative cell wall-binding protein
MLRAFRLAMIVAAVGLVGPVVAAQGAIRVGQNYRLNSDPSPFRGKDQVALAVDPGNPNHIVEVNANYLTQNCEGTASFDGGVTWTSAFAFSAPAPGPGQQPFQPTCRISNHLGETMFQTVAFGRGQNVYATSIDPRLAATGGEEGASTLVYRSTNGGRTWGPGVVAMPGGPTSAAGPYYELSTLAVDPGAGKGGADRIYSVAHETTGFGNSAPIFGNGAPGCTFIPSPPPAPQVPNCPSVRTAVSVDGAQTFSAGVNASPPGVAVAGPDSASQPVISPDHSVSVAWRTLGTGGSIEVARSTDHGQSWSSAVIATNVTAGGRPSSSHVIPLPSTGSSFPRLAVDKRSGNLYLVYNQGPPGPTAPAGGYRGADHFINPDSHVYFQRSLDHGATWSMPKLIDDVTAYPGSLTVQTRHPTVAVAPNGRVDIVWEDRRHWYQGPGEHNCVHTHLACGDARLGDTYYAYSSDGGRTFSRNIRVSDRSHNNDVGFDYRFGANWAFGPQSAAIGNDQVLIGWMDSREGSFDTDNMDVYLAKVNLNAPSDIPQASINQTEPVSLSVALSRSTYMGGGESLLAGTFATRSATKVVIVNQGDVAGALAGAVLARANLGPVLLAPASGLTPAVRAEIARLSPAGAYVVGDTAHLSDQVTKDLSNLGVDLSQIARVAGADDPSTAAAIAAQFDRRTVVEKAVGTPAFDAAIIANPRSPDAGAAAALAAARRLPILYVTTGSIPAATASALSSLNIKKTLVVGGPQWVSAAVLGALPSASRLGGADQYATSRAVAAESQRRGLPSNIVYVADGTRPMDAALLGAAVGRLTGIMVLSRAPLYGTAANTVSSFGLRNVDELVLLGAIPRPQVTHFGLTNNPFAVAGFGARGPHKRGTTFKYTLNQQATASIVISQLVPGRRKGNRCVAPTKKLSHAKKCTRVIVKGTLTSTGHSGSNKLTFSGRIGSRALNPGTYEATLTAVNAASLSSRPKTIFFVIVRS